MPTVYKFKPMSRLKGDAQKVGEAIDALRITYGGALAPKQIVSAAVEDEVLHPFFDWDDKAAADSYRETQARHLLRSILVVHSDDLPRQTVPVRAFVSIRASQADVVEEGQPEEEAGSYTSIAAAIRVVTYREELMQQAASDLDAYRARYALLNDVSGWTRSLEKARQALLAAIEESKALHETT